MAGAIARSGLPSTDNVAAQYRLHADQVANGELPRPVRSVLVEFHEDAVTSVQLFGMHGHGREAISALASAIQSLNAGASN